MAVRFIAHGTKRPALCRMAMMMMMMMMMMNSSNPGSVMMVNEMVMMVN